MSVKVRPYRNGGFEVDIAVALTNGEYYRTRTVKKTSRSIALRWGQERERHLLRHGLPTPLREVPTLNEFAPRFVQEYAVANRQKPSTIDSTQKILRVHLLPALGAQKLSAIDSSHVQQLKCQLADKAPKTVNNVLCTLSVMLKTAVEWKVLDQLPCTIRLLPVPRREALFHEFQEFDRLVEAAAALDWRALLAALLGGEAGLRNSEIVALQWADVDFVRNQISVRHSDWKGELTTPKNGRSRTVPLTERAADALRRHRHRRSTRVLCTDDGRALTRKGVWDWVARAAERAQVRRGVHILRHTFCSHLMMQSAPATAIQKLADHKDLTTTQRYVHLSPVAKSSAIRLLDARSRPASHGEIVETAENENVS